MKKFLIAAVCIFAISHLVFAAGPESGAQPGMGEQPGMQQPGEGVPPGEGQQQPGEGQQQPDMPGSMSETFAYDTFITESTGAGIDVLNGVWVSTDRTRLNIVSNSNLVEMVVGAAAGSVALTNVDLRMSSSLAEIPSCAFAGCENLETVVLPSSVTKVADDAFIGCPKLKTLSYEAGTTDPVTPDQPSTSDESETPTEPVGPDQPINPDQPDVPDASGDIDQPTTPDQPGDLDDREETVADMSRMETTYAQTFYGYIVTTNGIAGTLTVTTSKANARTGIVTVKAIIWPAGGKKFTVTNKATPTGEGPTTISFADSAETTLTITANGIQGMCVYGTIVAARDFAKHKTDARYAEYDDWVGTHTCAFATSAASGAAADFAGGYSTCSVCIKKKGAVTVTGTMGDGTTFSQSTRLQLSVDGTKARIPVLSRLYRGRAGGFGFVLELEKEGGARIEAIAPWDASCRASGGFVADLAAVTNGAPSKIERTNAVLVSDELNGVTISGLSLSSNGTTGALRGSYRAVFPEFGDKRYSVTFRGVTIDGVGYVTSVIKKVRTLPTEVKTPLYP